MSLFTAILAAALALSAGTAAAQDPARPAHPAKPGVRVLLANGRTLSGVLASQGKVVRVELDVDAIIGIPARDVVRFVRTDTPLSRYYADRAGLLKLEDLTTQLKARKTLAMRAKAEGLSAAPRREARIILDLGDPDDAELEPLLNWAHRELGHEKAAGRWMSRRDAMKARGYVRLRGSWVLAEERTRIEAEEKARREHHRLEREQARARQRQAQWELERRRLALERARRRRTIIVYPSYPYRFYGNRKILIVPHRGGRHYGRHFQPHAGPHFHPRHGTHYGPHRRNRRGWQNRASRLPSGRQPRWGRVGGHPYGGRHPRR